MKTVNKIGFIIAMLGGFVACQDADLEDFKLQDGQSIQVSASNTTGAISKTNELVTIPVNLELSGNASKAFEVALRINQDTVEKLATAGKLEGAVPLASGAIQIDNVAKVNYGSDIARFQIIVGRTEVEKYYGKKVAIGYTLDHADKKNNIDHTKNTGIIIIDTKEFLTVDDIHYISLQNGGNVIEARDRQNFVSASGGISVPLTANLASFPGNAFTVDIVTDADTIPDMVTDGTLPNNTVALQEGEFSISN